MMMMMMVVVVVVAAVPSFSIHPPQSNPGADPSHIRVSDTNLSCCLALDIK